MTLVGKEGDAPYERPPLSKEYLAREKPFERVYVRPLQFWAEKAVNLHLDAEVLEVKPTLKTVTTCDGTEMRYGKLVFASTERGCQIEPDVWLSERDARKVLCLTGQVREQRDGYALILLQAELDEDEDDDR